MVSTFLTLLTLQKIDKDLIEIRKEINERNSQLSNNETEKRKIEDELKKLELEISQTERLYEQSVIEVDESTSKVKKWEKRMHEIKNQREQQALLREIEHLKQQKDLLENQSEEVGLRLQQLKDQFDESSKELLQKSSVFEEMNKTNSGDLEELKTKMNSLEKKKNDGAISLNKSLFSKYKLIIARRQGTAVVEVKGQKCMGCNRMVTPQMWNTMHTKLDLFQCPSCQRYIFLMDKLVQLAEEQKVKIDTKLFA